MTTIIEKVAPQEIIRLDIKKNPDQVQIIDRAYEEIYLPAFPIAEERQTLEYMKNCQMLGSDAPREYVFIAAGQNLDNPSDAVVNALGLGIYYKKAQVGLMAYNATRKGVRGLGRVMVDERIKAFDEIARREERQLRGIFLEVNDPDKVANDVMNPHKRINLFKSWGAEIIPIDYTQPPLDPNSGKCSDLMLMNYPTPSGHRPAPQDTVSFLREMFIACGKIPPEDDADFMRMKRQLLSPAFNNAAKGDNLGERPACVFPLHGGLQIGQGMR